MRQFNEQPDNAPIEDELSAGRPAAKDVNGTAAVRGKANITLQHSY